MVTPFWGRSRQPAGFASPPSSAVAAKKSASAPIARICCSPTASAKSVKRKRWAISCPAADLLSAILPRKNGFSRSKMRSFCEARALTSVRSSSRLPRASTAIVSARLCIEAAKRGAISYSLL